MNHFRIRAARRAAFLVATAALCSIPASTAQAKKHSDVNFTLTIGPRTVTDLKPIAGNTFLTMTTNSTLAGDVDGPLLYMIVVAQYPGGTGNAYIAGSFTGTVLGRSGTAVLQAEGVIAAGRQRCTWRMDHGTGELAGIEIEGTCEGPLGGPIAMWGTVEFEDSDD